MKITINKEYSFSAAHHIPGHPKCGKLHGHNYTVTVYVEGPLSSDKAMVLDYHELDTIVQPIIKAFDHKNLDDHWMKTTAEYIATVLFANIEVELQKKHRVKLSAVEVSETPKTCARVERS